MKHDILVHPGFDCLYVSSFSMPFNCDLIPFCSSKVPYLADQKHKSVSTTTLIGKRIKQIAVVSSLVTVTKIRDDTVSLHGRIFLDQLKL